MKTIPEEEGGGVVSTTHQQQQHEPRTSSEPPRQRDRQVNEGENVLTPAAAASTAADSINQQPQQSRNNGLNGFHKILPGEPTSKKAGPSGGKKKTAYLEP